MSTDDLPKYGQTDCGHKWNEVCTPACGKLLFACAGCLKVLPRNEGLQGHYLGTYCSVACQLQAERGEHVHHKMLRLGLPVLERIAVALEKLTGGGFVSNSDDPFPGGVSREPCGACGANYFRDGSGHSPKCPR